MPQREGPCNGHHSVTQKILIDISYVVGTRLSTEDEEESQDPQDPGSKEERALLLYSPSWTKVSDVGILRSTERFS